MIQKVIGHSVLGNPIYAFGNPAEKNIIIMGGIHAREWITTLLIIELMEEYACTPGIWWIPLANPDGVEYALTHEPLWKANIRGVDLNVNFDADWGQGIQNVQKAGSENYIGPYPNSEPETTALIDFTRRINPIATVAYHSKGEVIYYPDDGRLAHAVAKTTGYQPIKTTGSTGGYSDWVHKHLKIPAVTIEVGNDEKSHPITEDDLCEIFEQNKDVPLVTLNI